MAEINWTDEAERWLKDIHDYIAQDSPESAIRVVEGNPQGGACPTLTNSIWWAKAHPT